jgi:hypothetical protein
MDRKIKILTELNKSKDNFPSRRSDRPVEFLKTFRDSLPANAKMTAIYQSVVGRFLEFSNFITRLSAHLKYYLTGLIRD